MAATFFRLAVIILNRKFTDKLHIVFRILFTILSYYEFSLYKPRECFTFECIHQFIWVCLGGSYFLYVAIQTLKQKNGKNNTLYNYEKT